MSVAQISRSVALLFLVINVASGYSHFRDQIPNGKNVPHPCRPNYLWQGVGHENPAGGGVRNPFGKDFDANGKVWDECLCQTDSDGDGWTNGEELGDPNCEWTPGDVPHTKVGLSHPGICEPMDSEFCQERNGWEIDCSSPEFICDELEETEDVQNVTIQLDPTAVPQKETTYICQGMELPSDGIFHMIASEPMIVNENVIHHITAFSCPADSIDEAKAKYSDPVECDMSPLPCEQIFALWAVGVSGSCLSSEYGVLMGLEGTKYVVLQLHWNNPEIRDDYEDSSGLVLHYTPNLRTFNGGTFTIGPSYLELPPGYSEFAEDGVCPRECMEYMFHETIYIPEIIPHMHYLGRKMVVEHWRDGQLYATLINERDYSYDSPRSYKFQPPVEVRSGDEFNVSCTFETKDQSAMTFFGEATSDEMCSPIIMYYPTHSNASYCVSINDYITYCGITVATSEVAQQCVKESWFFIYFHFFDVLDQLSTKCDPTGLACWDGCKELIEELRANHTCLHEDADEFIKNACFYSDDLPMEFVYMMISCNEWPDEVTSQKEYSDPSSLQCIPNAGPPAAVKVSATMLVLLLFVAVLF